jgi:hypothetical protein
MIIVGTVYRGFEFPLLGNYLHQPRFAVCVGFTTGAGIVGPAARKNASLS